MGDDEILILTRSLLSIVARANYVDSPTDRDVRRDRYRSFARQHLDDQVKTLSGMRDLGFEIDPVSVIEMFPHVRSVSNVSVP